MQLYNFFRSGTSHRLRIALNLKGLIYLEQIMQRFTYPVTLTPDEEHGGVVVTCRDVPELVTQGETTEDAISEAEGVLEAAIEMWIEDGIDIPAPSARKRGDEGGVIHFDAGAEGIEG